MRPTKSLALLIASLFVLALASIAQADTTVGVQTFAVTPTNSDELGQNIPIFQGAASGNYVLSVPTTGTLTSWSFLSGGIAPGHQFVLRVLRPGPADSWTAAGTSGPAAISSPADSNIAQGPFLTSLPVQAGDQIALQATDDDHVPIEEGAAGDGIRYFLSPFADGSSATLAPGADMNNNQIVPIQATVQPASAPPPVATPPQDQVPPSISGTPAYNKILTCNPGNWGGDAPISYGYAWTQTVVHHLSLPKHRVGTTHVTTQIGTGSTVVVSDLVPGTSTIACTVTAQNGAGTAAQAAAPVTVVATRPALAHKLRRLHFVNLAPVATLHGTTATCSTGTWLHYPAHFTYQWWAGIDGSTPVGGKRRVGLRATYQLKPGDAKRFLICRVAASNAAGATLAFSADIRG
jgi:hypothetical protein